MKVVYDFRIFSKQRYGGISRYFFEVAKEISHENDVQVLAPLYVNSYLRSGDLKGKGIYLPKLPGAAVNSVECGNVLLSNAALKLRSPEILHETYYAESGLKTKAPIVTTVYDMMHEIFPDLYPGDNTARLKAASARRADHIFCISKKTQDDLVEILGVDRKKTSVTHLGCDFHERKAEVRQSPYKFPYLLFVGPRWAHKNFKVLLNAYAASKRLQKDFKIVCFGSTPFQESELLAIDRAEVPRENFIHAAGDDTRLPTYYGNAHLYIYPSLYEGFGLPPLEAMALGCATVSSDAGSLPEVLGTGTEYFKSDDAEALRATLERVAYDGGKRDELIRSGKNWVKQYQWSRCAKNTLATYRTLL
jgi:glycosyltransferase involved in cell wall biosynthesis